MILPNISFAERPNRVSAKKDDAYYIEMSRYVLHACNNPLLITNSFKYLLNWNFYKDNQWIFNEDLEPFLRDEGQDFRNRIRWEYNIIKPFVEALVGTAIKSDYSVRAYNASPYNIERKTQELAKRLQMFNMVQRMPLMGDLFRVKFNLGATIEETEQKFNDEWVDYSELAANTLIRRQEVKNRFDFLKEIMAFNKALGGICIMKDDLIGEEQVFRPIELPFFLYDTNAMLPDLSDSEFMGDISLEMATDIYERNSQLTEEQKEFIEKASKEVPTQDGAVSLYKVFGHVKGRIPTYNLYWKDTLAQKFGYYMNEGGIMGLALIKEKDSEGYDEDRGIDIDQVIPKKDLPDRIRKKRNLKMNSDGVISRDSSVIRFCEFIPKEIVGEDMILDCGLLPYQECYNANPMESAFPYKVSTYKYKFGEIIAPPDSQIKPQRLINRLMSMSEAIFNNARGSSFFYEKSLIAGIEGGEKELTKKVNLSKPIAVDSSRTGFQVQNSVRDYDGSRGIQTGMQLIQTVGMLKGYSTEVTGVNKDMMGIPQGAKKAVGVQKMNIEQGSVMIESFFFGLGDMWREIYKSIANRGKKFYADKGIKLYDIEGREGYLSIQMDRKMRDDEMHIVMRAVSTEEVAIEYQNQVLTQLHAMDLIGDDDFANLYDRAEGDLIAFAVRSHAKEKRRDKAAAAQQQQDMFKMQQQTEANKEQQETGRIQMQVEGKKAMNTENNMTKLKKTETEGVNKIYLDRLKKKLVPMPAGK